MKRSRSALAFEPVAGAGLAVAAAAFVALGLPSVTQAATTETVSAPLFSISKTENKNYVQFAERLDAACAPLGSAPVFAFWRMLERDPGAVEPLLPREEPAYGIASQSVIDAKGENVGVLSARRLIDAKRENSGPSVRVALRALPAAPLLVESWRGADGKCEAAARLPIAGVEARLFNVHAVVRWPFGIARLLVSGWSLADGRAVRDTREL